MMEQLPLLESDSVAEVAGGIHIALLIFGKDLGARVDESMRREYPNWFEMLKQARKAEGKPTYDSFFDTRFLLSELKFDDQLVARSIPSFNKEWREIGLLVRKTANRWSHLALYPSVETYEVLVGGLAKLARMSDLAVAPKLTEATERAASIRKGEYKPDVQLTPVQQPIDTQIGQKVKAVFDRPPIGSLWNGPLGTRPIKISHKTRDVTERGASIKSELGPNADQKISEWLAYYPKHLTGEASVAEDGAVMAFVRGLPYLIGYMGEEPLAKSASEIDNPLRGFALDYQYVFLGDDVREITTNKRLTAVAPESSARLISALAAALKSEALFSATNYGELFTEDEDGQLTLITTVQKNNWFPRHFPDLAEL